MNSTRIKAKLHERSDVPDDDIPEIIALAEKLQDTADGEWGDVSPDELKEVARELDIRPEFVDEAIEGLASKRALERSEAKNRSQRRRKVFQGVVVALLALLLGAGALGVSGAGAVSARHAEVAQAEAAVEVVLERQASLAPQLLALSGGDPSSLDAAVTKVHQGGDIEAKLRASSELGTAMAKQLAETEATATGLLQDLGYELTGTQNRITTETRRLRKAQASHQLTASGFRGKVAISLGLASAP